SFLPVNDSISGRAKDKAIKSAMVTAIRIEIIVRSFSQRECDSRSSRTRFHKMDEEITTRRWRSFRKYSATIDAIVNTARSAASRGVRARKVISRTCLGEILSISTLQKENLSSCAHIQADICRSRTRRLHNTLRIPTYMR